MDYLLCDGYHIWERNSHFFLFDLFNLINVEITPEMYNSLSHHDFDEISDEMKKNVVLFADKGYFFYKTKNIILEEKLEGKEVTFTLTPIFECNLQCKYCFADSGRNYHGKLRRYKKAVLDNIAEYMINTFSFTDKFRPSFVSGGEPFYDFRTLIDIIDFFSLFFKNHKKELKIWICTNGTLINEEQIRQLDFYNIQIGISQDGEKGIHDRCRVNKNGQGTYDIIRNNVADIINKEDLSQRIRKVWGSAVITAKGEGFLATLLEHKRLGFTNSQLRLVQISKENSLAFHYSDLNKIYEWIDELFQFIEDELINGKFEITGMLLNENDYMGKILRRLILHKNYIKRCQAGRLHRSFTPEGDIYPCDSFIGIEQFKLGNVLTGENKVFINKSVLERENCKNCWIRFVCGGDCYYNSFCCNNDPFVPDNIFCCVMEYTVKTALYMLNNVKKQNKSIIQELSRIQEVRDNLLYS